MRFPHRDHQKLWDTSRPQAADEHVNGKPENAGKYIVATQADQDLAQHQVKTKSGKVVDLTGLKEGQTIDMMQMASVVSANIE